MPVGTKQEKAILSPWSEFRILLSFSVKVDGRFSHYFRKKFYHRSKYTSELNNENNKLACGICSKRLITKLEYCLLTFSGCYIAKYEEIVFINLVYSIHSRLWNCVFPLEKYIINLSVTTNVTWKSTYFILMSPFMSMLSHIL